VLEGRRYRLLLSATQQERAASYSAAGRCAFNLGKEQRDAALRLGRRMPGYATQCDLTELRAEVDWIRAVPVQVCQQALRDCDVAFQRYVRGLAGYPKWRKKGVDESFRVPANRIELRKLSRKWWVVRLPKLGWCRLRWTRPLGGQARNITVTMDRAGRWWASFCVDTDRQPGIPNGGDAVGVDRGVTRAYQTSDHESDYVNVPGLRPKEIERRRRLQRHFAHQNRDSTRRAKTKLQLARLYQREHNRRRDAIHNITIRLATEPGSWRSRD
jgi:putative transposase